MFVSNETNGAAVSMHKQAAKLDEKRTPSSRRTSIQAAFISSIEIAVRSLRQPAKLALRHHALSPVLKAQKPAHGLVVFNVMDTDDLERSGRCRTRQRAARHINMLAHHVLFCLDHRVLLMFSADFVVPTGPSSGCATTLEEKTYRCFSGPIASVRFGFEPTLPPLY
jgi:hypothetical protein